jgi:predicted metalloprotease
MRLGDAPESSNFEDRTGQSGGGMSLGGGAMGLIFSLVASRFGIVGILVLALGYCALSSLGGGGGILGGGGGSSSGESRLSPEQRQVLTRVLGSTGLGPDFPAGGGTVSADAAGRLHRL